jgi:hypothetical protein
MDSAGSRGTNIASSANSRRWRKGSLAQSQGNPWYVAYLEGRLTVMRVVRDRDEAIGVACAMPAAPTRGRAGQNQFWRDAPVHS